MRLALYEPDIPQNAGSLMRLGACLGVGIDIIEPCGFLLSDRNFRRAGMDYLQNADIRRHESWAQFRRNVLPASRLVLLTRIIEAIGLKRDDVYIANVIKCRPPGNRNPEPIEVATCEPFLFRQIDIINPKVIVALGTFAAQALLKSTVPISKLRGNVYDFRGTVKLIPTFHPAYLLRNRNNTDLKRDVWEDMKKARALLSASTD